ncbi:MAG: DsbA family oxidoreductase [Limibacillus sp.]
MRIDIFSDTVCPWCFIGKRRLERALEGVQPEEVEIHWRAFQLNPDMPAEGMDRRQYLETKFGGPDGAQQVYQQIASAGDGEGIDFQFKSIERTPNSVQSHRLVRFASSQGKQDAVVERLFKAYFLEGQNIGDDAVLVELAVEAGLDKAEAEAFIAGDEHREEILAEDLYARQQGINGVPCFIFNGRYALSGAQDPSVLRKVIDSLLASEDGTLPGVEEQEA